MIALPKKLTPIQKVNLEMAGMPGSLYAERPFELSEYVRNYASSYEKLAPISIKQKAQLSGVERVLKDPYHAAYTMCISSDPSDSRAKLLGAAILAKAIQDGGKPLWHPVIGGYKDEVRDNRRQYKKMDLLILSNVPGSSSTDVKFEKVRDLLELYHGIPRIVLTSGIDPLAFFNYMGSPVNYTCWIRGDRCRRLVSTL